jgi:hypothetical protein
MFFQSKLIQLVRVVVLGLIVFIMLEACLWGDDPNSVLVFPGANSRETYFTLHNIKAAQLLSKGNGIKVGILDHSFATELHPKLYAGGKNFVKDNEELLTKKEWHGYWMATVLREIAPEVEIYALNTYVFDGLAARAEAMAKAIDWAIEQKLDILTYSAEAFKGEPRKILDNALDRAHKANIITTFIHTGHPGNILPSGLWSGNDDGREPDVNVLHYDYSVVFIDEYRKAMVGEISCSGRCGGPYEESKTGTYAGPMPEDSQRNGKTHGFRGRKTSTRS